MRIVVAFSLILIYSCNDYVNYNKTIFIEKEQWTYHDSLQYDFEVIDTVESYNLELELVHNTDYQFQNLYVKIFTTFPDRKRIADIVSLNLANKFGVFFGKCNNETCHSTILLKSNFRFDQIGIHRITISQYSRLSALPGIESATLRLLHSQDK